MERIDRHHARVLVVGVGGLGAPASLILARAGVGTLILVDDDRVERTNLHRQILFADEDVGRDKLDAAARGLERLGGRSRIELRRTRLVPENAAELVRGCDLVIEGADNFATKFLVADACRIAERPVIHAAALRTVGTVFAVAARGAPCYRCLFEDVPVEAAPNCAEAGVLGPLVGWVAAAQADLALAALDWQRPRSGEAGDVPSGRSPFGELVQLDAHPRLRRHRIAAREKCALCGPTARPSLEPSRYAPVACGS